MYPAQDPAPFAGFANRVVWTIQKPAYPTRAGTDDQRFDERAIAYETVKKV